MDAESVMAQYAAAWSRGDPDAAFSLYAEDVVMHLPGRGSLAGDHVGKTAVISAIRALLARTDGTQVEVEVLNRLVSDDSIGLVIREAVTRGDAHLELRRVNVYRVVDAKISDIDIFEADQYDVDAFFD